jgi:hypothetical protein
MCILSSGCCQKPLGDNDTDCTGYCPEHFLYRIVFQAKKIGLHLLIPVMLLIKPVDREHGDAPETGNGQD